MNICLIRLKFNVPDGEKLDGRVECYLHTPYNGHNRNGKLHLSQNKMQASMAGKSKRFHRRPKAYLRKLESVKVAILLINRRKIAHSACQMKYLGTIISPLNRTQGT